MRADVRHVLALALAVYVAGIWWGIPGQWAPDELPPDYVVGAMQMFFAGGWHDKYPPVQYYLDGLVCLPFVAASWFGWIDLASFHVNAAMLVLMRLLSVAMALGAVVAIYRAADELYGRRGAIAAAVVAGFTPPVAFYAKLANVDAPSLFWIAWALRFYVRSVRGGGTRALLGYGLTAATAIATKDQSGGFFVLPSLHLAWLAARQRDWRPLGIAAAVSIVVLVFELGIPFNLEGFKSHLVMVTGEASQPFMIKGSAWTRQLSVATLSGRMLAWSMTWVGLAAGIAGALLELRRRRFAWLLLPILSYYLFFLVIAGYVYDRFVIGAGFAFAILAGGFVAEVLRPDAPRLRWRQAACAAGAAFLVWSAASMDLMMILDSRYAATRWLASHRTGGVVGLVGFTRYLPVVPGAVRVTSGPDDFTPATQPKYIVVNAEVMRRERLPPLEQAWHQWLTSDRSPYVVAARFDTAPAISFLTYTDVFRNGVEETTTNLDKAGPEIVVYWRPGVLR